MEEGWEGCLSVPGMRGLVPRYTRLRYRGFDQHGKPIDRTVGGFHARVVQHEVDHLNGILYPMRIRDLRNFGFNETLFPGQESAGRLTDVSGVDRHGCRPSDASISLRDMSLFREQAFVGGRWESAANGQTKTVFNPGHRPRIGTVPNLGAAETRRAIEAADKALPDWRARTAKERAQILRKWFDLMMANQEDLAVLMTRRAGQAAGRKSRRDRLRSAFIEWFGEEGKRAYGDVIPSTAATSASSC